jgi:hypothetical protein
MEIVIALREEEEWSSFRAEGEVGRRADTN